MDFRLLGPLEVATEDGVANVGSGKRAALLIYLLINANEVVSTDRLIDELWAGDPPPRAAKSLQVYVSQLRKALHTNGEVLATRGSGYVMQVDDREIDVTRFERSVAAAERALQEGDAERTVRTARAALALWRGPALYDVAYESFAQAEVARLEELRLVALETRIEAELVLGNHAHVVAELEALVNEHPTRERFRAQLMLALYRCGRQADALDVYRRGRKLLIDELGLEPSVELRELEQKILAHDEDLGGGRTWRPTARRRSAPPAARVKTARRGARLLAAGGAVLVVAAALVVIAARGSGHDRPRLIEDSIGIFDAGSNALRSVERAGRGPSAIAVGAGSTWVANALDDTVTRLGPGRGNRLTIPVGAGPSALAFGAGSLWVVSGERDSIAQVDPTTDKVVQWIPVGGQPTAVAVSDGAVWVAQAREDVVTRVKLSSGRVTQRIAAGAGPTALAAGAGALWVAAEDADQLIRIDPGSGLATRSITVGHAPDAVVVAAGAVWVANREDGTVSRVDPASLIVTATARVGARITALAPDGDGVVAADDRGVISRLDHTGLRVTSRIPTGTEVSALAGDGRRFLAVTGAVTDAHHGGTLTTNAGACGGPCTVDPAFPLAQTWGVLSVVYDGLVAYRRAPGVAGSQIVPALAAQLPRADAAGRTYSFTLRQGLRYADGRPVRASDVRFSLERSIRLGHELLPGFFDAIRGAPACERHPRRCSLARGVVSNDRAGIVTLHLRHPDPMLLHRLANPGAAIVPAGTADALDGPRPPGTGPYRIERVEGDGTVRLARNPRFRQWSDARPNGFADRIVVRPWTGLRSRLEAVERGRSDVTEVENGGERLTADQIGGVVTRHPGRVAVAPRLVTDFMFLNVREPPFDDRRVRRAVNLAVDRARMVAFFGGPVAAAPACNVVPAGLPNVRPACAYTRNPSPAGTWAAPDLAEARRLVAASGTRGARVTVWTDTSKIRFGRYFAHLLRDLGYINRLKVVRAGFDYFHVVGDSRTHAQIGMFGWQADFADPGSFYDPILSCRARHPASAENLNLSQFCDPVLDRLVRRAEAAAGPAAAGAWRAAQRRLALLAPAVPLVSRRGILFVSGRAGDVRQNPFLGPLLEQIWVH